MKRNLLLTVLLLISYFGFSQDIIILRENGSEIKSKVIEINDTTIKYKKWGNIDGPLYNIKISLVSMIKYINGQQDRFDEVSKNIDYTENEYLTLPLIDVPYYLISQNNNLKELESANSITERQRSGIWGHKTIKSIQGSTSNIRISNRDNLQFLIQLDDSKVNPHTICELYLLDIEGNRQHIVSTEGAHGKRKENGITLKFKKLNDTGLYQITFPKKLAKGEYFFSITEQTKVYAFGIDK